MTEISMAEIGSPLASNMSPSDSSPYRLQPRSEISSELHPRMPSPTRPPPLPPTHSFSNIYPSKMHEAPRSPVKIRHPSFEVQNASMATIEGGALSPSGFAIKSDMPARAGLRPGLGDRLQSIRKVSEEVEPSTEGNDLRPSTERRPLPSASTLQQNRSTMLSRPRPAVTTIGLSSYIPPLSPPQLYPALSPRQLPLPLSPIASPTMSVPSRSGTPVIQIEGLNSEEKLEDSELKMPPRLPYLTNNMFEPLQKHFPTTSQSTIGTYHTASSDETTSSASSRSSQPRFTRKPLPPLDMPPPIGVDLDRSRSLSPHHHDPTQPLSPVRLPRNLSSPHFHDSRPMSYVDLLNIPYSQQVAQQNIALDNAKLRSAVGSNAALLDTRKTIEIYRANVKKTSDSPVLYEFAVFLVNAAQDTSSVDDEPPEAVSPSKDASDRSTLPQGNTREGFLKEARQILQRLADKSYVFAQYYLGDGYASGVFNKGKPDLDRAFTLFVSAGKHGHAEAGYRAALCYEFGWGCRKDPLKAVQFYRQSAAKNHPGAATRLGRACLAGDLGLGTSAVTAREGIKWLKRASESADVQHNSGPYELGLLHLTGHGDELFIDEAYTAQLFTRAAELGHPDANLRMGKAYEHGLLMCPRDPALSIHFYTGAADAGVPEGMMALCAWYMVGAPPMLPKDEPEAYEWAKQAAKLGFPKAEYAVGYFTEMGIGCACDTATANTWYVHAAEHGDSRATQRLAIIAAAEADKSPMEAPKDVKKKKSFFDWRKK